MSTKTQQTSSAFFDPTAMSTYQGMQGGLGSAIGGYMNNPFQNPFMQQQMQMGTNQANLYGQSAMSNLTRNLQASGMGGTNNPAGLEMMQNQMRSNMGMRSQLGFQNPMQNAFTAQQNAMGLASQYRPLQTGGQQTQTQGGLGSWLPQLAGMGLSMGMGGMNPFTMFGGGQGQSTGLAGLSGSTGLYGPGFGAGGGGGSLAMGGYNSPSLQSAPSPFMR